MAEHFHDTSAAVKRYRSELGTAKVDALLADPASHHYLSTLAVVEPHSVFGRLVREGKITAAEFHRLRGRLLNDIASGLWRVVGKYSRPPKPAWQSLPFPDPLCLFRICGRGGRQLPPRSGPFLPEGAGPAGLERLRGPSEPCLRRVHAGLLGPAAPAEPDRPDHGPDRLVGGADGGAGPGCFASLRTLKIKISSATFTRSAGAESPAPSTILASCSASLADAVGEYE